MFLEFCQSSSLPSEELPVQGTDPLLRERGGLADVNILPLELCRINVCDETFLTPERKYAQYEPSGLITGLSCLLLCELM